MKIIETELSGVLILEPRVFKDDRGSFCETFNERNFEENVLNGLKFVQDNQSISSKNVLRGLHFQNPPYAQGKLVRVIVGSVLDVAVDIRKDSPTYGKHVKVELTADNNRQFWIPPGFAHGFLALEDDTIFSYKCTNYYSPESEGSIKWSDPDLKIDWSINAPIVSEKDQEAEDFCNFISQF